MFEDHHTFAQTLCPGRPYIVFPDDLEHTRPRKSRKISKPAVGKTDNWKDHVPRPVDQPAQQTHRLAAYRRYAVDRENVPEIPPSEEHYEQHGNPETRKRIEEEESDGQYLVRKRPLMSRGIDAAGYGDQIDQKDRDYVELNRYRQPFGNLIPHIPVVFIRKPEIEGKDAFYPQDVLQRQRLVQPVEFFCLLDYLFGKSLIAKLRLPFAHLQLEHRGISGRQMDNDKRYKSYPQKGRNYLEQPLDQIGFHLGQRHPYLLFFASHKPQVRKVTQTERAFGVKPVLDQAIGNRNRRGELYYSVFNGFTQFAAFKPARVFQFFIS